MWKEKLKKFATEYDWDFFDDREKLVEFIEKILAEERKKWEEEKQFNIIEILALHKINPTGLNEKFLKELVKNSKKQIKSELLEQIEKIDVSGGGNGRRIKEQIVNLLKK